MSPSPNNATRTGSDDLFEKTRMSFGQHLDELRRTLIRALIGAGIGIAIGFMVATPLVKILTGPLERAIKKFNQQKASEQILQDQGWVGPETASRLAEMKQTPRAVLVDPGQLVSALRSVSPDFLQNVSLQPWRFAPQHIPVNSVVEICKRLSDVSTRPAAQAVQIAAIAALIPASNIDGLRKIADSKQDDPAAVATVVGTLNDLLDRRELNEDQAFSEMLTLVEPGWLARQFAQPDPSPLQLMKKSLVEEFQPDLSRRLNRAVITAVFAPHILPQKLDLVPIEIWEDLEVRPQSLNPTEGFMIWMKAGMIAGLVLSGPWIFIQMWSFVAAGLYPHEKKYIHIFLPVSLLLFGLGVLLVFVFVFDAVLGFFLGVNYKLGIEMQPRINEWLSFVLFLPLGFGIAFQLPLVMLFLNRINIFSVEAYMSKWRIAVMVIFIVAMVLTPADPLSMILLAVPLTFLYFFGVILCYWFPGTTDPFQSRFAD